MAYVNTARAAKSGWADRIAAMLTGGRDAFAKRRVYVQTVEELNRLTDRELADLGISRLSIEDVARDAAYGK